MRFRFVALVIGVAAPLLAATGFFALPRYALPASAASATGTVTGQVVWNAPIPVPYAYGGQGYAVPGQPGASVAPDGSSEATPGTDLAPGPSPDATDPQAAPAMPPGVGIRPGFPVPIRPPQPRMIPAGAVLVAVQGTSLSARTDDTGHFRIEGVPVQQYLTVAVGPVQGVSTAVAIRPNVFLQDANQTVDLGRLYLGQTYSYGPLPYGAAPSAPDAAPELQAPSEGGGQ